MVATCDPRVVVSAAKGAAQAALVEASMAALVMAEAAMAEAVMAAEAREEEMEEVARAGDTAVAVRVEEGQAAEKVAMREARTTLTPQLAP